MLIFRLRIRDSVRKRAFISLFSSLCSDVIRFVVIYFIYLRHAMASKAISVARSPKLSNVDLG